MVAGRIARRRDGESTDGRSWKGEKPAPPAAGFSILLVEPRGVEPLTS